MALIHMAALSQLRFILLLVLATTTRTTTAFPSGAGSCNSGQAVAGQHLTATEVTTGTVEDNGFSISINGSPVTQDSTATIEAGAANIITIAADSDGLSFRGLLIRVGLEGAPDAILPIDGDATLQVAILCDLLESVSGITHTDASDKTSSSGTLVLDEQDAPIVIEVTVVEVNSVEVSRYFYTSFNVQVDAAGPTAPVSAAPVGEVTNAPASSPVLDTPAPGAIVLPPVVSGQTEPGSFYAIYEDGGASDECLVQPGGEVDISCCSAVTPQPIIDTGGDTCFAFGDGVRAFIDCTEGGDDVDPLVLYGENCNEGDPDTIDIDECGCQFQITGAGCFKVNDFPDDPRQFFVFLDTFDCTADVDSPAPVSVAPAGDSSAPVSLAPAAPVVDSPAPISLAPAVPTAPVGDSPAPVSLAPVGDSPAPITLAPIGEGIEPCPTVPDDGCSVCGEGLCVTVPGAILEFPDQDPVDCNTLESAGFEGLINLDQCSQLAPFLADCGCANGIPAPTAPVTAAPAVTTAPASTIAPAAAGCPAIPDGGCSVCGEGLCVSLPDVELNFPDQPPITCGTLQEIGLGGLVDLGQCALLPPFIEACECADLGAGTPAPGAPVASNAPVATNVPTTVAPTAAPIAGTLSPTLLPTLDPTMFPSMGIEEPTLEPSLAPSQEPTAETSEPTSEPTRSIIVIPTDEPAPATARPSRFLPPVFLSGSGSRDVPPRTVDTTEQETDTEGDDEVTVTLPPETESPTQSTTSSPTETPTGDPTVSPVDATVRPSVETASPSSGQQLGGTATLLPTPLPTVYPTASPTQEPTGSPTQKQTEKPTERPTSLSTVPLPTVAETADDSITTNTPTVAPAIDLTSAPIWTYSPAWTPAWSPAGTPAWSPAALSPADSPSTNLGPTAFRDGEYTDRDGFEDLLNLGGGGGEITPTASDGAHEITVTAPDDLLSVGTYVVHQGDQVPDAGTGYVSATKKKGSYNMNSAYGSGKGGKKGDKGGAGKGGKKGKKGSGKYHYGAPASSPAVKPTLQNPAPTAQQQDIGSFFQDQDEDEDEGVLADVLQQIHQGQTLREGFHFIRRPLDEDAGDYLRAAAPKAAKLSKGARRRRARGLRK